VFEAEELGIHSDVIKSFMKHITWKTEYTKKYVFTSYTSRKLTNDVHVLCVNK